MALLITSCESNYTPKPRGYFKIDFPKKEYKLYSNSYCPFSFELPVYSEVFKDSIFLDTVPDHSCWLSIRFPEFKGTLYLNYKEISGTNTLGKLIEDSHRLTHEHVIKAEAIDDSRIATANGVYGLFYEIEGDAASAFQFFLTDSTDHFLRCSLYFYATPNSDSIGPVVDFLKQDIFRMIESLKWDDHQS